MIGRNINGYMIIDSIGSGAFGNTYTVRKDGEIFAMKILKPEAMSFEIQSRGIKRFQREIRSLQKAKSEFVVRYIDSGVWVDKGIEHYYIVMEFVEGMNFSEFLTKNRNRLLKDEALFKKVISEILTGLYDIHNVNIIHRDLKPANIYITRDKKVKILDFGLVKMLDYSTITTKGKIVGTPLFMSPEMIEGKTIDYRSDLYSFGVLLYHIYTNEYPFTGENVFVLLNNIVQSPPKRISDNYPDISNAMENIILRLLEKQPYLRPFRSASELRNVINEIPLRKLDIDFQQIEDRSFKQKRFFIRILHTEKTELINFLMDGRHIDGIEFPANYVPLYKNQINDLIKFEIPYYFDPVTNRLAYSTFTNTKGLVNLPYVHDKYNRITPKTFYELDSIKRYVSEVLEWQLRWSNSFLVAPFHYSRSLADDWLKIDLKLLDESIEYKESRDIPIDLYAGICINIEDLTDEENRLELVNKYSRTLPDGFIFYVNNINEKTTNISQLYSYIDLLLKFKSLKRPLIAARVGTLGLGIIELGIDAFSSGIASLSSFSEYTLLLNRQVRYDMERKYYFRDLLLTLRVGIASEVLERFPQFRCSCRYCNKEYQLDIINAQAKQHFLEVRTAEIQLVNNNKSDFIQAAKSAQENIREIRKAGIKLPSQAHIDTWIEVFSAFKRGLK